MRNLLAFVVAVLIASPLPAAPPRDTLIDAAFVATEKTAALHQLTAAIVACDAILARDPVNREAKMQRALAIGYRGKLTRSRGDALAARRAFEVLAAADPRDPEAQIALGGWHISAILDVGSMMARTAVGARKAEGLAALDRASRLGANRAAFPAMNALFRIALDKDDIVEARRLAEAAARAPAPTSFDRVTQRRVMAILPALRAGDGKTASAQARALLPFGRLRG